MSTANMTSAPARLTEDAVLQIIAEALDLPAGKLDRNSKAADVPEWDSMGILSILSALDREGVKCDIGNTDSLQSVQGILQAFRAVGRIG